MADAATYARQLSRHSAVVLRSRHGRSTMKLLVAAGLVLVATGLPAFAQWGPSPGYRSPGYDRGDEDAPQGYGRGYDDRPQGYGRRYDDRSRGYGREYRDDDDRPRRYGRSGGDVGPTGL